MHNVLPNSHSYIYHLERRARRAGVIIQTGSRIISILLEKSRVIGVKTSQGKTISARGGVVLAAGDFTSSPALKARFMGPQEAKVEGVNLTATGDGQLMAEAIWPGHSSQAGVLGALPHWKMEQEKNDRSLRCRGGWCRKCRLLCRSGCCGSQQEGARARARAGG